jgi:two-component system sensor histidine kinase PilS (NtrC family)
MDRRRVWHVFRAFNISRLVMAMILLGIFLLDERSRLFGKDDPNLFLWTSVAYMGIVALAILGSVRRRPSLRWQSHLQTLIDLVALSLLIHASGGISSSLSILLVTAVAASGILLPLLSALAAAAAAFFILLAYWLYGALNVLADGVALPPPGGSAIGFWLVGLLRAGADDLGRLGILGGSFFIATLLTYTLADRARRSEALVYQRSRELLEMAELNRAIVRYLQSGIVVVDRFARIRLMNDTARELLDHHASAQGVALRDLSSHLSQSLTHWLVSDTPPKPFRQASHLPDITPRFSHLGDSLTSDTLIFLEDSGQVAQRLQHIKLAALGRMTAGIAHEIRNPLTSVSHAAQLLMESTTLSDGERRLGRIIHDNVKRANRVIVNVLDLSRRDRIKPEDIDLPDWLEEFRQEFLRSRKDPLPELELQAQAPDLTIRFDVGHLHQVLWNLCANACLHGALPDEIPRIRLRAGRQDTVRAKPFLEVIDQGPGINEAEARKLFEPFFTTKAQGTGLGLYMSREICEANGAQLQYIQLPKGSCFRITFAYVPVRA